MADKPDAQQRIRMAIGHGVIEMEIMRDQIEQLTALVAERDATIAEMKEVAKIKKVRGP